MKQEAPQLGIDMVMSFKSCDCMQPICETVQILYKYIAENKADAKGFTV